MANCLEQKKTKNIKIHQKNGARNHFRVWGLHFDPEWVLMESLLWGMTSFFKEKGALFAAVSFAYTVTSKFQRERRK